MKKKSTALILSVFCGTLGIDRFYLGYIGLGFLKLFTFGGALVLYILDIIHIANGKLKPSDGSNYLNDGEDNPYKKIEEISRLHEAGILTDEEFCKEKLKLLGSEINGKEKTTKQEDPYEDIVTLTEMHDAGFLSDEEYEIKRTKFLKEINKKEKPMQTLEKLFKMKENGDLTNEQFEQMKKEVLKKI